MESAPGTCQKLWGGRFSRDVDVDFHNLNKSIDVDKRMYAEDIQGSIAYAEGLCKAKILSEEETLKIVNGLRKVKAEWDDGQFVVKDEDEDIHSANERRLSELIGDVAKKLHTGRSRNDQTITDTKLWLRTAIDKLLSRLMKIIEVFTNRAEDEISILMPGYTHLQRAQPVRWSHWLLSHAWSVKSDVERLREIRRRCNASPLGSGALAGNPFRVDRAALAVALDFEGVTNNSMHAVGDRDFVAEFLFWASLTSVHLSRLAEDLIIYSSEEFGFVRLSDAFSTGSSLMPQKRNADSMELLRGKSGTIIGKSTGFLVTMKGTPSTYNKDLQEDKVALFSAFDAIHDMLYIAEKALLTLTVNPRKCADSLTTNMLATDLAYYLVRRSVPFRQAHHLVGKVVALAESKGVELDRLSVEELRSVSELFDEDVLSVWNFAKSVEQYESFGGTGLASVQEQIRLLRSWMKSAEK